MVLLLLLLFSCSAMAGTMEGVATKEAVATREAVKIEDLKPSHLILTDTAYFDEKSVFASLFFSNRPKFSRWIKQGFPYSVLFCGNDVVELMVYYIGSSPSYLPYYLKGRVNEESERLPAVALSVSRYIKINPGRNVETLFGDLTIKQEKVEDIITYGVYFSKTIDKDTHGHFSLRRYSVYSTDSNNDFFMVGLDKKFGSFMGGLEVNYDSFDKLLISGLLLRGPLEWWFRPQVALVNYYDVRYPEFSESTFMYGFYWLI